MHNEYSYIHDIMGKERKWNATYFVSINIIMN